MGACGSKEVSVHPDDARSSPREKTRRDSLKDRIVHTPTRKASFTHTRKGDIWERYVQVESIGDGIDGKVMKIEEKASGDVFACKIVNISEDRDTKRLEKEIALMKMLDHPNVIQLQEVWVDDERHSMYLVMEIARGPDLYTDLKTNKFYEENVAAHIFIDALKAVRYIHSKGVVHRDLKLANFVFESTYTKGELPPALKLIDFGFSDQYRDDPEHVMTDVVGTSYFLAPEIAKQSGYNEKCDLWSLGVILYMLLCGEAPFYGKTDEIIVERASRGAFDFSNVQWGLVSGRAKDLIRRLLVVDPADRLTTREAFEHPWVQKKNALYMSPPSKKDMTKCFVSIDKYTRLERFQKLAMAMLVFKDDASHRSKIKDLFLELDTNGDGMIDYNEFRAAYEDFLRMQELTPIVRSEESSDKEENVRRLFDALATDGRISYSDFLTGAIGGDLDMSEKQLRKTFEALDTDHSGSISQRNLKVFAECADDDVTADIIRKVDFKDKGEIDFEEFCQTVRRRPSLRTKEMHVPTFEYEKRDVSVLTTEEGTSTKDSSGDTKGS